LTWADRALRGLTRRSWTLESPNTPIFQTLSGGATASGQSVTVEKVLGLAPFWRGVNLLADAVGQLPCKVYRDTADGRVEASRRSQPWRLLHDKPNPDMAADEFWALAESHLDTWGNAFIWKRRVAVGIFAPIEELWLIHPSRVKVGYLISGERYFILDGKEGDPWMPSEILHIRGLSKDGKIGWSPVQMHRESLGAALAAQEYKGRFWANDTTPGVALIHPGSIKAEAVDRIKARWKDAHQGVFRAREPAVLGEGMTVHQMTMPLKDAQFIEGERLDATKQALILRLPPHFVAGDNGGNSLTYSTVEGEAVSLLKFSVSPRLVRIQRAVSNDPDLMPTNWHAEFDTGALLRATTKESYDALAVARWMTVDEKRKKSGLEPLPDGKGEVLDTGMTMPEDEPGAAPADDGSSDDGEA